MQEPRRMARLICGAPAPDSAAAPSPEVAQPVPGGAPLRGGGGGARAGGGGLPSLIEAARSSLRDAPEPPTRAVFGIAGPVVDNRCEATNLPWHVDGDKVGAALGG